MPAVLTLAWLCLVAAAVWFGVKRNWPLMLVSIAMTLVLMASLQYLM